MPKKTIISEIKLLALDLALGGSLRATCPFCNSKEETFTITRLDQGLIYNCYRSSCEDSKGFIGTLPTSLLAVPTKKTFKPKPLRVAYETLTKRRQEEFQAMYDFKPDPDRVFYDFIHHRWIFKVMDLENLPFGFVAKSCKDTPWYGPKAGELWKGPKAVNYFDRETAGVHFTSPYATDIGILVEDCISAEKIEYGAHRYSGSPGAAVALLGTNLNKRAAQAVRMRYKSLIVMLDPGAEKEAKRIRKEYNLYFDMIVIVALKADPKDTPIKELMSTINGTKDYIRQSLRKRGV